MKSVASILILAAFFSGCNDCECEDTINLDKSKISVCLASKPQNGIAIVVGEPGATDPHRNMLVENETTRVPGVEFRSENNGAFIAGVGAREGDMLTVYSYPNCLCDAYAEFVTLIVRENCE